MNEYHDNNISIEIKEGIVFITIHAANVEYELIDFGIKQRLKMCDGKTYPIVTDIRSIKSISKQAKERLADIDGEINTNAVAAIYKRNFYYLIVFSYLLIYNSNIPTRVFTSRRKAIKWAQKFITKN